MRLPSKSGLSPSSSKRGSDIILSLLASAVALSGQTTHENITFSPSLRWTARREVGLLAVRDIRLRRSRPARSPRSPWRSHQGLARFPDLILVDLGNGEHETVDVHLILPGEGQGYLYSPWRKLMPCSSQTFSASSIPVQPWQLP